MRLSPDPACRLCRLVFCVTMLLAWAEPPQFWATAAAPRPPLPPPAVRAAQAQNSLKALEDSLAKLPRDSFDVGAVVKEVGPEPAALFQWVRDRTCWAPYRGALRDDRGVLMDRLGNSLDRACLLASLLKAAGHPARLAHADLYEWMAQSLLSKVRRVPLAPPAAAPPADANPLAGAARAYGLDEFSVRSTLDDAAARAAQIYRQVAQRSAEQAPLVRAAVGHPKADPAAAERPAAVAAMRDHWWVQYQNGDAWTDLDPLLPDAVPGSTVAPAQRTLNAADLNEELRQQVVVRVVIERWKDGKAEQATVLEHAFLPSALLGKEIHLGHRPMDWPADFNPADPANLAERLKAAVLAQHEWVPILVVGTEVVMQAGVTDAGEIDAKPNFQPAAKEGSSVVGSGQGVLDAFGGNNAPPPPPAPKGVLTAEWIEYETRVPGEPPRRVRRELFDLTGPAARAASNAPQPVLDDAQRLLRGLAMFGETDILLCPCNLSAAYLTGLGLDALLANRKVILAAAAEDPALTDPATGRKFLEEFKPMPGELEDLAFLRLRLGRFRDATFIARPNILTRHVHLHPDAAGRIIGCRAIDIVDNHVGVRPGFGADPFDTRLAQGVIDTNLESALLTGCGQVHSAAEAFAAAGSDAKNWTTLRRPDEPATAQLAVAADVRSRIAADLSAGCVVVVPRAADASMTGWWRVDPATGSTLGMGASGWGPSLVEYTNFVLFIFFASFFACETYHAVFNPQATAKDTLGKCWIVGIVAAMVAVLLILLYEGFLLVAGGAGAGGAGAGGAGAGGGPGGGGGMPPGGGGGPGGGGAPPGGGGGLPGGGGGSGGGGPSGGGGGGGGGGSGGGGGGGGSGGGGGGGGSGGGGGPPGFDALGKTQPNYPPGVDPLGNTQANYPPAGAFEGPDLFKTLPTGGPGGATLGGTNTLSGLGGLGGTFPPP